MTASSTLYIVEIIEHPQTQYVLEGNNASFHCNAQGKKSYWRINNDTISIFHTTIRQRYISHGFTFLPPSIDRNQSYYNLTMHVLATSQTNNSRIECQVSSHNHSAESDAAYLIVFTEFCKYIISIAMVR